jgi:hypothetical protein
MSGSRPRPRLLDRSIVKSIAHGAPECLGTGPFRAKATSFMIVAAPTIDVSYVAPQAHGIVNLALHREYSPGIIFKFSQGRKDLYHF